MGVDGALALGGAASGISAKASEALQVQDTGEASPPSPLPPHVCVCGLLPLAGFRGHEVTSGYWNVYVSRAC